jgi:hypothetical protein
LPRLSRSCLLTSTAILRRSDLGPRREGRCVDDFVRLDVDRCFCNANTIRSTEDEQSTFIPSSPVTSVRGMPCPLDATQPGIPWSNRKSMILGPETPGVRKAGAVVEPRALEGWQRRDYPRRSLRSRPTHRDSRITPFAWESLHSSPGGQRECCSRCGTCVLSPGRQAVLPPDPCRLRRSLGLNRPVGGWFRARSRGSRLRHRRVVDRGGRTVRRTRAYLGWPRIHGSTTAGRRFRRLTRRSSPR